MQDLRSRIKAGILVAQRRWTLQIDNQVEVALPEIGAPAAIAELARLQREDHILDGDYIVVEQTQVANPGEIVVALVGEDDATVKRFYREAGGKIRLQPANSQMAPIILPAADVKVQGRVVGVLRKYS